MSINLRGIPRLACQKVLPASYDDSLSYYEQLCKLTEKMNEIIEAINNNFEQLVREEINKFFADTVYDSSTETLILSVKEKEI